MTYRDELEAATERAAALAADLEREQAEKEKLQRELETLRAKEGERQAEGEQLARQQAEGRARRVEAEKARRSAEEQQARDKEDAPRREQEAKVRLVCNPLGFLLTAMGFYGICVLGTLGWGMIAAGLASLFGVKDEGSGVAIALLAPFGIYCILAVVALVLREARVERERSWLASLPFAVTSYEAALSDVCNSTGLRLELKHVGEVTAAEPIADLAAALYPDSKAVIASPHCAALEINWGSRSDSDYWGGRRILRAFHRLVDRVLLPLHARQPLSEITLTVVKRSRWG